MFEVRILGSVKGMESGEEMRVEIMQSAVQALEKEFERFGLWEVFVTEVTERKV